MNPLEKPMLAPRPGQGAASVTAYLQGLWEQLLRVPHVNPDDSFFSLGGDSVLVIEMLMSVSSHYDREFQFNAFFPKPNLRTLGELILGELKGNYDHARG